MTSCVFRKQFVPHPSLDLLRSPTHGAKFLSRTMRPCPRSPALFEGSRWSLAEATGVQSPSPGLLPALRSLPSKASWAAGNLEATLQSEVRVRVTARVGNHPASVRLEGIRCRKLEAGAAGAKSRKSSSWFHKNREPRELRETMDDITGAAAPGAWSEEHLAVSHLLPPEVLAAHTRLLRRLRMEGSASPLPPGSARAFHGCNRTRNHTGRDAEKCSLWETETV